jgi:hypothetical protein
MAQKSHTEENANYAGKKTSTLHTTCTDRLSAALTHEAHKSGLTKAQAVSAACCYWVDQRVARRKKTWAKGAK